MNQLQSGSFEFIPLANIRPSGTNPRKSINGAELEEMSISIRAQGVIQPIVVRASDGQSQFEIVSGERRYRAAKLAQLAVIPAIVRDLTDDEALDLQMVENLQRSDLHPMEEAEGFRTLMFGNDVEELARKSGKSLAHVLRILKLLDLSQPAKDIYADGHLTLDHALLLARLTLADQERALCYLLEIPEYEIKKDHPAAAAIQQKMDNWRPPVLSPDEDDSYHEWQMDQYQRRIARRMVKPTAAELKSWIMSHILLQLSGATWILHDASLLPTAGACTECPKRTGANEALFADMMASSDTCTDPTCFSAKQKAQADRLLEAAKESGTPLLKISAKSSHRKLETPAVEVKKGSTSITKKTVKEGQWVPSSEGECKSTVQAVMVDGQEQGKLEWVCPNQSCRTHRHTVDRPVSRAGEGVPAESWETRQKREEQDRKREEEVRRGMMKDIVEGACSSTFQGYLGMMLLEILDDVSVSEYALCEWMRIPVQAERKGNSWEQDRLREKAARNSLTAWLHTAELEDLEFFSFAILAERAIGSDGYLSRQHAMALAHQIVEHAGFDPKATEEQVRRQLEQHEEPAEAAKVGS